MRQHVHIEGRRQQAGNGVLRCQPCTLVGATYPCASILIGNFRLGQLRQVATTQRRVWASAEPSQPPAAPPNTANKAGRRRVSRMKTPASLAGPKPDTGGGGATAAGPASKHQQEPPQQQQNAAQWRRAPPSKQQQPAKQQRVTRENWEDQQQPAQQLRRQQQLPLQQRQHLQPQQQREGQQQPASVRTAQAGLNTSQEQPQQLQKPAGTAGARIMEWHARKELPAAWDAVEDAPPSAEDRRQSRQQQRELLHQCLEQLHKHVQRQRFGSAPVQASAAGKAVAAGSVQQATQMQVQQQPSWTIEAAEALCELGMPPEQAATALVVAHAYALRCSHQDPVEAPGTAAAGGEAAPAGAQQWHGAGVKTRAPAVIPSPLSAAQVKAVCLELAATAKVPVVQLQSMLAAAPQLLACTPEQLRKQHEVVSTVWRRPRRLAAALLEHPAMLGPDFPAELGRSLRELSSLGFSREQVSAAILRFPAITQLTGLDVVANLRSAGLDLDKSTSEVLQFLAEQPHVLGQAGSAALGARLALFATWRLPPPLCPLVLARCPPLLKEPEETMQAIVDILMGYGMTWHQLGNVLLGYPAVLRADPSVVHLTLKLLADFEVGLDKVVQYPRVFIHDPVQYIGPRLAYLKAYRPAKLCFRLVSILSRADDEFASGFAARLEEEYAVFKDSWVRQYNEQVNMPAGRSSLSRAWLREVTDELWL